MGSTARRTAKPAAEALGSTAPRSPAQVAARGEKATALRKRPSPGARASRGLPPPPRRGVVSAQGSSVPSVARAAGSPNAGPFARRPVLEQLEPRLLLSADLNPLASDALFSAPSVQPAEFRAISETGAPQLVTSAEVAPIHRTNELVFVDTATPDYQALVDDMRATAQAEGRRLEFVLIDANSDGLAKITEALAKRSNLDAVHIVSHAHDGAVRLGAAELDFDTLLKHAGQIKGWGNALTRDGDILFYGCDLAATQNGQSLIDAIARLTGADVAASEDPTGSAAKGGDWDLEFKTGSIEADLPVSESWREVWDGILTDVTVTNNNDNANGNTSSIANLIASPGADGISLREAIIAANNTSGADRILFSIGG